MNLVPWNLLHVYEDECEHAHLCALNAAGLQWWNTDTAISIWRLENNIFLDQRSLKQNLDECTFLKRHSWNVFSLFSSFVFDVWLSNISVMLRKSYEFEDLLQSSSDSCRVDWYAQSRLGFTRTLSEENVYEDIIGKLGYCYLICT